MSREAYVKLNGHSRDVVTCSYFRWYRLPGRCYRARSRGLRVASCWFPKLCENSKRQWKPIANVTRNAEADRVTSTMREVRQRPVRYRGIRTLVRLSGRSVVLRIKYSSPQTRKVLPYLSTFVEIFENGRAKRKCKNTKVAAKLQASAT